MGQEVHGVHHSVEGSQGEVVRKEFAEKLADKIVEAVAEFEVLHQLFTNRAASQAADWVASLPAFRAAAAKSQDFVVTADSILNLKKRKLPSEPAEFKTPVAGATAV